MRFLLEGNTIKFREELHKMLSNDPVFKLNLDFFDYNTIERSKQREITYKNIIRFCEQGLVLFQVSKTHPELAIAMHETMACYSHSG